MAFYRPRQELNDLALGYSWVIHSNHAGTYDRLNEVKEKYGRVRLILLDPRIDLEDANLKHITSYNFLGHAIREDLFDTESSYLIGVRAPTEESVWDIANKNFAQVYSGTHLDPEAIMDKIATDRYTPTYLSIDLSVLDPAFVPDVVESEWAGLLPTWMKSFLGCTYHQKVNWIGMDVCGLEFSALGDDYSNFTDAADLTILNAEGIVHTHLINRKA